MAALLNVDRLTVALPTRSGYAKAVEDLSFAVDAGEVMGIAGESGSGKTITALSLFGLLPHGARVTGSIRLDGTELTGLTSKQFRAIRGRQIAMVSQDPATALHPILPISTQLTEHMRRHLGVTKAEALSRAARPRSCSPARGTRTPGGCSTRCRRRVARPWCPSGAARPRLGGCRPAARSIRAAGTRNRPARRTGRNRSRSLRGTCWPARPTR